MHTGGGGGLRGTPHVPPIKIFEKLPHKNAIKHAPPLIFSQPQVPPSKELVKKNKDPPLDFQLLCIYVVHSKKKKNTFTNLNKEILNACFFKSKTTDYL
jgi:hypothetical protein